MKKKRTNGQKIQKTMCSSFKITDRQSCEKAIQNGVIAVLISAGITAIFGVAGFFANSSDSALNYLLDPYILIDVFLMLVLAFFISRKSRVASTLLLIYFVLSKIDTWLTIGEPKGLLISILFFLYYFTAMRATYIWHSKHKKKANSETT